MSSRLIAISLAFVGLLFHGCAEEEFDPCEVDGRRSCPCAEPDQVGWQTCDGAGEVGDCVCGLPCDAPDDCPDDGNSCTYYICMEGLCQELAPPGQACDDGDPCTETDTCQDGACAGTTIDCDDGDPCTADACGEEGCTNIAAEGCCVTHDDCDFHFLCDEGTCVADPTPCGSAEGTFPADLTELSHDDQAGSTDVSQQTWTVTDAGILIADTSLYEATRFELEHPARIHGFRVMWAGVPERDDGDLVAGLYGDFGYNGFDFWQATPLWEGSRCAKDSRDVVWVDYVLSEPLEVTEPGLIYVAHHREEQADPAFLFDVTSTNEDGSCGSWNDCHSSMTFPELKNGASGGTQFYAWNGLSWPFQYDFRARLMVEYVDQIPEEERWFQKYEAPPTDDGEEGEVPTGSRPAFGDFDDDGDEDLLLPGPALWRNDDGVFVNVTEESGLADLGVGSSGGVWGDWDNDGCLDAFLFQENMTEEEVLLRSNCDGTFEDVTFDAGIYDIQLYNPCGDPQTNVRSPTTAAGWIDLDGDGFLDLYVSNMICWSAYTYYLDTVWHNEGDGTFQQWTGQHGFYSEDDPMYASRGANAIDADRDGDVDLLVNNYVLHPNLYYQNQGDGTVQESAHEVGIAGHPVSFGSNPSYGHSIGAAWGDLDNDADFDLVVANLAHPRFYDFSDKSQVLLQQEDGTFMDIQGDFEEPAGDAGLRFSETHSIPVLADFNLDGDLDLMITATYDGRPTDYYVGQGDGTFELRSYASGLDLRGGWGAAWADVDLDGDPDLMTSAGLYINEHSAEDKGHWLQIRPVGNVISNRAALGATVEITVGDETRIRHITGGTAQGCQDAQVAHFGLGDDDEISGIQVMYPGGDTVVYEGPFAADQRIKVFEDGGVGAPATPAPEDETPDDDASDDETPNPDAGGAE